MSIRELNGSIVDWMMVFFIVLVTALVVQTPSYAQDSAGYPEDRFYELLDEYRVPLDEARAIVASEFDAYSAAEVAAYLCAPNPDAACEDSEVWAVWEVFLYSLSEGISVKEVLDIMSEWDATLIDAIAIYWCSPPAGDGCGGEEYNEKETVFVVEEVVKERPASRDEVGAQFFGGEKRCSRARDRRC
jgi:hypothetical protein